MRLKQLTKKGEDSLHKIKSVLYVLNGVAARLEKENAFLLFVRRKRLAKLIRRQMDKIAEIGEEQFWNWESRGE